MMRRRNTSFREVLDVVRRHGAATPEDIAAALQVTRRTATRHLKRLLELGLVCEVLMDRDYPNWKAYTPMETHA
jgi:DNA-binding transcriptional ArsR family regulator